MSTASRVFSTNASRTESSNRIVLKKSGGTSFARDVNFFRWGGGGKDALPGFVKTTSEVQTQLKTISRDVSQETDSHINSINNFKNNIDELQLACLNKRFDNDQLVLKVA